MARRRRRSHRVRPYQLAQEIYDRLEAIHKELLRRRSQKPDPATVQLTLHADLYGSARPEARRRFASMLIGRLAEEVQATVAACDPLHPGRVYCYWCESADCSHARPPAARMVFTGYNPTGLPLWEDFVSLCLRLNDPRVDRLHRNPPEPFSIFIAGADLHRDQLAVFGAKSRLFRIRFQAAIGYLSLGEGNGTGRVALTVQAVSTQRPGERQRLRLNLLGRTEAGSDITELLPGLPDQRLTELFQKADLRLRSTAVQRKINMQEIQTTVRHVAAGVEKIYRQASRRTKHARLRHSDPSRPAGAALRDVLEARTEDFLADTRRNTVVVLGPNGRVHVFNGQGLHVTSLTCSQQEVNRRVQRKIWRPLETAEIEKVRTAIVGRAEQNC